MTLPITQKMRDAVCNTMEHTRCWAVDDLIRAVLDAIEIDDGGVLAGCRAIRPHTFEHGLDGMPGDGPATRMQMRETRADVTKILTAVLNGDQ